MNVSVIIPTFNAGEHIKTLIDMLLHQSIKPEIIVVDSQSEDKTAFYAAQYGSAVKLISVSKAEFDHGQTRDMALRHSNGDYVLFLTQDALPTDRTYIEKLLAPFSDECVAAVFGRQLAYENASEHEKLTRQFNYPAESRTWSEGDISRMGIKAYFLSDVCSAYRREAYFAVGGFDYPIKTNEDMLIAEKLLHSGFSLAYCANATVFHSHKHSLSQEFRRNALIGEVLEQYKRRLTGTREASEGLKLVEYVLKGLLKNRRLFEAIAFIAHAGSRYLGIRYGKCKARRKMKDSHCMENKTVPQHRELSTEEIQKGEAEILRRFKSICEAEDFKFCLYFGTLIGAVRHKGFIPWDDDIDVVMPRESYERFLAYCRENADKLYPFALLHYSNNKNLHYSIARFSDQRYIVEEDNLKPSGMGLFIDIYPFDECADSAVEVEKIAKRVTALRGLCILGGKSRFTPNRHIHLPLPAQRLAYYGARLIGSRFFAFILDKRAKRRNGHGYAYVGCSAWQMDVQSYAKREWMLPVQMSFEGELYPVPSGYDKILSSIYGDYMKLPPPNMQVGHHYYRAYKK